MKLRKILIVEDDVLIAEHIKDILFNFGMEQVFFAENIKSALDQIDSIHPELVLLDLHLENTLDGLEIAKIIDEQYSIPYIFITANADILVVTEAILTNAAAYITKPIKKSDLFAAVQIALKLKPSVDERYLSIKNNGSTKRIPINEIMYIESNSNYIYVFSKNEKTLSRQSLSWAEKQLPKEFFLRVHHSFLVNTHLVTKINAKSLYIGDTEIPISRNVTSDVSNFFKEQDKRK